MPKFIQLDFDTVELLKFTGVIPHSFSITKWEEEYNKPPPIPVPPPHPSVHEKQKLFITAALLLGTETKIYRSLDDERWVDEWGELVFFCAEYILNDFIKSVNLYYHDRQTQWDSTLVEKELGENNIIYYTFDYEEWKDILKDSFQSTREYFSISDMDAAFKGSLDGLKVALTDLYRQFIIARIWEKCGFTVYMGVVENYRDELNVYSRRLPEQFPFGEYETAFGLRFYIEYK